jgi:hypothetical protein
MGYASALDAAGAKVLEFRHFGDYQGSWYALVLYEDKKAWAFGSFGSCTVCDAFEAEFGMLWDEDEASEEYKKRLADFGRGYLDNLLTQEQAEAEASSNIEWDYDAEAMLEWIKSKA